MNKIKQVLCVCGGGSVYMCVFENNVQRKEGK